MMPSLVDSAALSAGRQALLAIAHRRCGHSCARVAAGFGTGFTTVYWYIAETVDALAVLAPDLTAR